MRTVDTNVVVILVGKFFYLNSEANIWVAFGAGKKYTYCHNLGEERSLALLFFHSFTGCDTTSAFSEEEKDWHGKHGTAFQNSPRPLFRLH